MAAPRVLFVTTSYPCSPVDRAGPFVHSLARALVRCGIEVEVLAPAFGDARGRTMIDGVAVHRFQFLPARWQTLTMGFGGVPAALKRAPWRLLQLPLMLAVAAAKAIGAAGHADVLHAHWLPNLLPLIPAGRLRRRPRLVTLWGTDVEWFERSPSLQPAFRALLRGADGVVAINEHMRELFGNGDDAALRLIPSGVDTDLFHPRERTPLRTRLGVSDVELAIVFVGSLIPRKGADLAIEALARMSSTAKLLLVGEGPEHGRLADLTRRVGVEAQVAFLGSRSLAEVAEIMAAADAFVLPSHYEGRPNVVLEAQASGLAVVASDIPGCRDLVEHGETGLLSAAGDAPALAQAFDQLAKDRSLRHRLGTHAVTSIRDGGLTWDACARRYADFYADLIGARATGSLRATHASVERS